jgi:hypothetical protein
MGNQPQKIAMTAPVVVGGQPQKMAMTAPVTMASGHAPVLNTKNGDLSADELKQRGPQIMQFNLPSQFTLANAPRPTNPKVQIREIPPKFVAAETFSGSFKQQNMDSHGFALLKAVQAEGLVPDTSEHQTYYCAGFNPPWTPAMFKTNEVYVDVIAESWMHAALQGQQHEQMGHGR